MSRPISRDRQSDAAREQDPYDARTVNKVTLHHRLTKRVYRIARMALAVSVLLNAGALNAQVFPGLGRVQGLPLMVAGASMLMASAALIFGEQKLKVKISSLTALAAFLFWICLSSKWSLSSSDTLQAAFIWAALAVSLYAVLTLIGPRGALYSCGAALGAASLLGVVLFMSGYLNASDPLLGGLRGIFIQKNVQGRAAAFGLLCLVLTFSWHVQSPYRDFWRLFWMGSLIVSLALSGSGTAATSILLTLLAVWLLHASGTRLEVRLGTAVRLFLLAGAAAAIAVLGARGIVTLVLDGAGRDATFTGRTTIWQVVRRMIDARPLVGYGYSSFWSEKSRPASVVYNFVGERVPHSHNGLLDLLLGVGWVGFGLVALSVLPSIFLTLRAVFGLVPVDQKVLVSAGLLTFSLLINVTESQLMSQVGIGSVALLLLVVSTALQEPQGREVTLGNRRARDEIA